MFTVLTEETPNIDEIRIMMRFINYKIPDDYDNTNIIPTIKDNTFSGEWLLTYNEITSKGLNCNVTIRIRLFKGKTSSVDYMLFKDDDVIVDKDGNGSAEKALCILESTKTSDDAARNTAVLQRISKFTTYDKMYPNSTAIKVMFWIDSKWRDNLTDTAILGFKMMDTLNIHLYATVNGKLINIKNKYKITSFNNCREIIDFKNNIKEKKGNKSIKLLCDESNYKHISLKLDKGKGKNAGRISHDPNVGFLSAVVNCFEKFEPNSKYIVDDHNIKQSYFDKKPSSKLWYSCSGLNIQFTDCVIKELPTLPEHYFAIEREMTEKLATILCDMTSTSKTIFSNHGGCALTYVQGKDYNENVGRKMPRPDIVFMDNEKNIIQIIEGKLESELDKGIKQLSDDHLNGFINILKKLYPNCSINKGLCITIDDINNIKKYNHLEYPIKFALDKQGRFIDLR